MSRPLGKSPSSSTSSPFSSVYKWKCKLKRFHFRCRKILECNSKYYIHSQVNLWIKCDLSDNFRLFWWGNQIYFSLNIARYFLFNKFTSLSMKIRIQFTNSSNCDRKLAIIHPVLVTKNILIHTKKQFICSGHDIFISRQKWCIHLSTGQHVIGSIFEPIACTCIRIIGWLDYNIIDYLNSSRWCTTRR